jgi:hypothetical protein
MDMPALTQIAIVDIIITITRQSATLSLAVKFHEFGIAEERWANRFSWRTKGLCSLFVKIAIS